MPRDMDAPIERDTAATIRIRRDTFVLMFMVIGAKGPTQIGVLMGGTDRKTVRRALEGATVGEVFMASAVTALRRHADQLQQLNLSPTLDSLFEVVEVEAKAEVAA